jgi:hypothetical protein
MCQLHLVPGLDWEWGGCSDNFHFGSQVAQEFLDSLESGNTLESRVNLHNNQAGRIVSDIIYVIISPPGLSHPLTD